MRQLLPFLLLLTSACTTRVRGIDGLTYVKIPAGSFSYGCTPDETGCYEWGLPSEPQVVKSSFWIGQTEVTQRAYKYVLGTTPSRYPGEQRPVDDVSWNSAQRYCQALGMRLPTALEWEYAARGGAATLRYAQIDDLVLYDEAMGALRHEVQQKRANGFGLYEMVGNMWEWVADSYTGDPTKDQRQMRGGAFKELPKDPLAPSMHWAAPETTHPNLGFRCAADTLE